MLLVLPGWGLAADTDPRLEEARSHTAAVQAQLDDVLQRMNALEADIERLEAELADLRARAEEERTKAGEADALLAARIRDSYVRGAVDPTIVLLGSGTIDEAREQARLLGFLANTSLGQRERAQAQGVRLGSAADEARHVADTLEGKRAELDESRAQAAALLEEARGDEREVAAVIAAEQAEAERKQREQQARERAAQQRAARASGSSGSGGSSVSGTTAGTAPAQSSTPSGGVACPVGQPRNYSDTWGAPRSGGRRHMGTDILAPRGTPIYAYESGTVTRLWSASLGGISLYLRGDSGNMYFYTHLQGYVSGLSAGQRVAAGQQVGYNGDTGNAAGIPHLHFEVMPGGGGNVNPYPYVRSACG